MPKLTALQEFNFYVKARDAGVLLSKDKKDAAEETIRKKIRDLEDDAWKYRDLCK